MFVVEATTVVAFFGFALYKIGVLAFSIMSTLH
jgi:hypothetical protein